MSSLVLGPPAEADGEEAGAPRVDRRDTRSKHLWGSIGRGFVENRAAVIGLALIVLMVLFSFVGPLVY
ncbi:MAG TPA: hypothetical protein VMD59_22290, partial [Acidimicrobiales bacterium]|nr:hypothetical protein [Acidimicrobiales bacterium]